MRGGSNLWCSTHYRTPLSLSTAGSYSPWSFVVIVLDHSRSCFFGPLDLLGLNRCRKQYLDVLIRPVIWILGYLLFWAGGSTHVHCLDQMSTQTRPRSEDLLALTSCPISSPLCKPPPRITFLSICLPCRTRILQGSLQGTETKTRNYIGYLSVKQRGYNSEVCFPCLGHSGADISCSRGGSQEIWHPWLSQAGRVAT